MNEQSALARIEAGEKTIANIFCEKYAFSIPPYQRPYAWESEQVEELLNDLIDAMEPDARTDGFYFLGSVVLVKQHGIPDAKVVDGQQRLTTLTILFAVLRDLTTNAKRRATREEYIKQVADPDKGLREKLRLQLRRKDQSFFEKTIQRDGATDNFPPLDGLQGSAARIVENARIIRDRMNSLGEDKRNAFIRFVLQNCFLVVVEVPTDPAARRIFTVLNARGLDLNATDILKADLLERAGEDKEPQLAEQWENIEAALGRERFNELFVHVRMVHEREKPRTALEVGFPAHVPAFTGDAETFFEKVLEPYSKAFELASDPRALAGRFGRETTDLIASLDRLDNKDWLPPLLLCLRQRDGGKAVDVPDLVFKLERLSYYLFVTRADVNARMARYADVMNDFDPDGAPKDGARQGTRTKTTGLELTAAEARKFFDALDGDIYEKTRVVKPLLIRLEQASSDGSASYDYPVITVEHVCPQTIARDSQWERWFADRDDHDKWLHRLGNLVLLNQRKNPAASNWDLERKKNVYFMDGDNCPFILTQEVREAESWTPKTIGTRQMKVLGRLAKTWRLEDDFRLWTDASAI